MKTIFSMIESLQSRKRDVDQWRDGVKALERRIDEIEKERHS